MTPEEPRSGSDDDLLAGLSRIYQQMPVPPVPESQRREFDAALRVELARAHPELRRASLRSRLRATFERLRLRGRGHGQRLGWAVGLAATAATVAAVVLVVRLGPSSPEVATVATTHAVATERAGTTELAPVLAGTERPADTLQPDQAAAPFSADEWIAFMDKLAAAHRSADLERNFQQFKKYYPKHPLAQSREWRPAP